MRQTYSMEANISSVTNSDDAGLEMNWNLPWNM